MPRLRNRGPSSAELVRQSRINKLLSKYGAYSRNLSLSTSSLAGAVSTKSSRLSGASSSLQLASRRVGEVLHEDAGSKLSVSRPSQLVGPSNIGQGMDKGLALAAAQYVSRVLSNSEPGAVDAQTMKEDFLHALERDWGFTGAESLSLGRLKITIKRRDNDVENIRRRAELEKVHLEKARLQNEDLQSSRKIQTSAVSSSQVSSTTKVVKTRVVKTSKRTVQSQTVRVA